MRALNVASVSASVAGKAPLTTSNTAASGSVAALQGTVLGHPPTGLGPLRWLGQLLLAWQTRADTRRQLASLDARLLRDIGLHVDDVHQEISKPFWTP